MERERFIEASITSRSNANEVTRKAAENWLMDFRFSAQAVSVCHDVLSSTTNYIVM
jgi:hypothetical protein